MENKRESWLDGLKGFAILLVILGHVLSGYMDAETFPEASRSFYHVRTWIYSFHMPLFFLLSGYTFTLAYYPEGRLRRRGFRDQMINLFWTYTLFALLQWLVKILVPQAVNEAYTAQTLKNMYLEPLGNFWYLYVLFVFYGLAALLRLPRWPPRWLLLFGAVSIVAADCHMDWVFLTRYRILYHLFFFLLGSALCRYKQWLKKDQLFGLSWMFLAAAALIYVYFWYMGWWGNWKFLIALATCYVMVYQFRRLSRLSGFPLFQFLGKYCLELYLLHTFFTAGLRSLLPALGVVSPWCSVWLNFLISTVLSLILALVLRRIPGSDLIFRPARFVRSLRKQ